MLSFVFLEALLFFIIKLQDNVIIIMIIINTFIKRKRQRVSMRCTWLHIMYNIKYTHLYNKVMKCVVNVNISLSTRYNIDRYNYTFKISQLFSIALIFGGRYYFVCV